jgi:cofilin
LIAKITEDATAILLESKGGRDATFDDFIAGFPISEPRYGVFDLEWQTEDGRTINKIVFVTYVPDTCKSIAVKFPYANSKEVMKQKCTPSHKEIQINDRADLTFEEFRSNF